MRPARRLEEKEAVKADGSTRKPMRILHVVGGMNRAGVETWLMHVLRNIDRERYRMDFLVHTDQPCAYDDEIRALGSKLLVCSSPRWPLAYSRRFVRLLRMHGPYDIVHSHVYLYSGLVLRLAKSVGVSVRIAHMHPSADFKNGYVLRLMYRLMMAHLLKRNATVFVVPSEASGRAVRHLVGSLQAPIECITNCVNLSQFHGRVNRVRVRKRLNLPLDKPLIVYVARFVPHKNHFLILRVADRLNEHEYRAHFVMIGSHGELLEYFAAVTKYRSDVSVLLDVENVADILCASDLFVFPSLSEGFGVVALEAAAAGLPIVATDLPAIREACVPSHREFMFSPGDDETCAANIVKILDNSVLRGRLSSEARAWVAQFGVDQSISKLLQVYHGYGNNQA